MKIVYFVNKRYYYAVYRRKALDEGPMRRRDMSANDYPIQESERRYR